MPNKQSDAKEMERWCLARATQDEDVLRSMAEHDKSSFVRAEAIRHITDQGFLYQSALNDPSSEVRWAAICRIDSPDRIKEIALHETNGDIQYHLLYDIRDADVIAYYANSSAQLRTREKAVKLLEDQKLLYRIFIKAERLSDDGKKYEWQSLAYAAFDGITDIEILRSIVRDKKLGGTYRKLALMRVDDAALCEELIMDDCESVATYAASKVKSQELLIQAVYTHDSKRVRFEAMCGLDERRMIEVIESHTDSELRTGAINKYHNMPQSMAIRLAMEDKDSSVRAAAMYHVTSREVLLFAAMNDPYDGPAIVAYDRLKDTDDETKWRILKAAVNRNPRFKVIRFCWNKEMLMFSEKNDPDEGVRRCAGKRLEKKMFYMDQFDNTNSEACR